MITIGEQAPDAPVWINPDTVATTRELAEDGAYLLLFYLFDWTGT